MTTSIGRGFLAVNKKALTNLLLLCYLRDCGLDAPGHLNNNKSTVFDNGVFQEDKFKDWTHSLKGYEHFTLDDKTIKSVTIDSDLTVGWSACGENRLDFSRLAFFPSVVKGDGNALGIDIGRVKLKEGCFFDREHDFMFETAGRPPLEMLKSNLKENLYHINKENFSWRVDEENQDVAYIENKTTGYSLTISNRDNAHSEMRGKRLHDKIDKFFETNPTKSLGKLFFDPIDKLQNLRENGNPLLSTVVSVYVTRQFDAISGCLAVAEGTEGVDYKDVNVKCHTITSQLMERVMPKIISLYEQEEPILRHVERFV